jgi:hypothetical protein
MIEIHFTLTEAGYLEAQALYLKDKQPWARNILKGAVLVGALLAITSNVYKTLQNGDPFDWTGALVPLTIAVIFIALLPYLQRHEFRKRFKIEAPNLSNAVMQLNNDGVRSKIAGRGEGTSEWSTFSNWIEGESLFILISGYTFRQIPKSVLDQSAIREVRDLLAQHITRKRSSTRSVN